MGVALAAMVVVVDDAVMAMVVDEALMAIGGSVVFVYGAEVVYRMEEDGGGEVLEEVSLMSHPVMVMSMNSQLATDHTASEARRRRRSKLWFAGTTKETSRSSPMPEGEYATEGLDSMGGGGKRVDGQSLEM